MPLRLSDYVPIPFTVDGTPPPDPGPEGDPAGDLSAAAPLERALASLGVPVLETLCRQAGEVELEIPAPDPHPEGGDPPLYRVRVGVWGLKRDGALRTAEGIRDALLSRHPGLTYPDPPKDQGRRASLSERFLRDRLGYWLNNASIANTRIDNRTDPDWEGVGGDDGDPLLPSIDVGPYAYM